MAELSIIIPTFNSMKDKRNGLKLVLYSIRRQNVDLKSIEIIFIDNGSDDDTVEYIENWMVSNSGTFSNLQLLINHDSINRSKSRNIGVENASGEKILFMDDDTIIYYGNTLEILLDNYYRENTFFCGAQRYWTIAGWEFERIRQAINSQKYLHNIAHLPRGISRETGFRDLQEFSFIGNFGGIMKKDFLGIGGFDSTRFPGRQEDVELMYRLLLNDFKFIHLPDEIKVIHLNHPIIGSKNDERLFWINEFKKREHEEGYYFCINHLFGVYEDHHPDHPVLKKINE